MSILIKTMTNLPEYCYDCPCHDGESGYCQADETHRCSVYRPFWCPLVKTGTEQPDIEAMLSTLDHSMECVLESDHRSFTNQETENGWLFDTIIEWRKMIQPYIKEEG